MTKQNESIPDVGAQVTEAVDTMAASMIAAGNALESESIAKGWVIVEELTEPIQLNFGKFMKKTTRKTPTQLGTYLDASVEDGGVDAFALSIKGEGGSSDVVEIGKKEALKDFGHAIHGDPESDFVLIVHGENPSAYYVARPDINQKPARLGEQFQFGVERSLGQTFQGGEIEKIVAFTDPVQ